MSNDPSNSKLSRRAMMKIGGMALVGVWSQRELPAIAGRRQRPGGNPEVSGKAIFLPPDGSTDVAVHSRAENLFWTDVMMEHAGFFAMLMPGLELASQRGQAENFQRSFQTQHDHALPGGAIVLATEELIDFETTIEAGVNTGRIKSIIHPTLADHMRRETLKFVDELKRTGAKT